MTNVNKGNSLIIGSPQGLTEGTLDCPVCQNPFDAADRLKTEHFTNIYIVFSDLKEPKNQILKTLSQVSPESRLSIIARMHEETEVIELLSGRELKGFNYLIAPVKSSLITHSPAAGLTENEKDRRIQELEILVLQDDLTGLHNRRYLRHFLPAVIQQAESLDFQVTLLLFDIDDFKRYNDSFGHSVGDRVLRQTASLIRRCCRTQDVVARLGGDEFAVVFWDSTCPMKGQYESEDDKERRTCRNHPREAVFMAERFRREMSIASFDVLGLKGQGSLTISGGMATYPTDAATAENLFEKADQAMFEAKRSGKNRLYLVGGPAVPSE